MDTQEILYLSRIPVLSQTEILNSFSLVLSVPRNHSPMFFHWPQRGEWSVSLETERISWQPLPLAWACVFLDVQQPWRPKNLSLFTLFLKDLFCLSKSQPRFSLLNFQAHPDTKHGRLPPKATSLTAETQPHGIKAMSSSTSLPFSCTNSFDCTRHKTTRMVWRMALVHLPQFPLC